MSLETGETSLEAGGVTDITQDLMTTTQMRAQEETIGEREEETLHQKELMAIGTHEAPAKRFHAWGNL